MVKMSDRVVWAMLPLWFVALRSYGKKLALDDSINQR